MWNCRNFRRRGELFDDHHLEINCGSKLFWVPYQYIYPHPSRPTVYFQMEWSKIDPTIVDMFEAYDISYHWAVMITTGLKFNSILHLMYSINWMKDKISMRLSLQPQLSSNSIKQRAISTNKWAQTPNLDIKLGVCDIKLNVCLIINSQSKLTIQLCFYINLISVGKI